MASIACNVANISRRLPVTILRAFSNISQNRSCSTATPPGTTTTTQPADASQDVTGLPTTEQNTAVAAETTLVGDTFDQNAVEKLLKDASKDMPIDMTNPYARDRIECILCRYKLDVDYKNTKLLSQFVSSFTGNVYEKHITRLCDEQQKRLVNAIRKSRSYGYMPTLFKSVEFLKDPKIFDPNRPIKPNPH
uniref:28S ribosomal protein S18c n=1 Tax=Hirondellea gigas TaxID=1518452 RepID=A0A2P2I4G6_9CRUS